MPNFRTKRWDYPSATPFPEVNYDLDAIPLDPPPKEHRPPALGVVLLLAGHALIWLALGLAVGFVLFRQ